MMNAFYLCNLACILSMLICVSATFEYKWCLYFNLEKLRCLLRLLIHSVLPCKMFVKVIHCSS